MRYLFLAALIAIAPASVAQTAKKDYAALVDVDPDDDGVLVATSRRASETSQKNTYSTASTKLLTFWLEARKPEAGPTKVLLVGSRLTVMTPKEAPKQREWGPSDPTEPAFVGSPWREADLRYRGAWIECFGDAYYCNYETSLEVELPDAVIREMLAKASIKDIPIALSPRRKTEWRVPREELVATLDKHGVLAEFGPK